MEYTVYILYSEKLSKFYTGFTSTSMQQRMSFHLSDHKGFTSKAKDWRVIYTEQKTEKSEAMILEKKIKKRGAKRYLEDIRKI